MKYVISLVLGLVIGAAMFVLGLIHNPLIEDRGISPLSVTDAEVITLNFSAAPKDTIIYTNNGDSVQQTYPEKVQQLWEAPIHRTSAMVALMRDARNRVAGIGIKFSSDSERTRLFHGEAIVDSVWYLYLPEHGSLFVYQAENYWPFLRDVALPAWLSSAKTWRGSWFSDLTSGPGALGLAAASGGSGRVEGLEMVAVESMSVRAFSASIGLLAADGRLIIELPEVETDDDPDRT